MCVCYKWMWDTHRPCLLVSCQTLSLVLEERVLLDEDGTSVVDFLKGISMLKVTKMIAASCNKIKEKTLRLSWRKILPIEDDESQEDRQEPDADPSAAEFQS